MASAADDGAELREMVTQTLEARGVLNMVRAARIGAPAQNCRPSQRQLNWSPPYFFQTEKL